jgi:hypothetical protein
MKFYMIPLTLAVSAVLIHCVAAMNSPTSGEELGGLDDEDETEMLTLFPRCQRCVDNNDITRQAISRVECPECQEEPTFKIPKRNAMMSVLVRNILAGDEYAKDIELKRVSGSALKHIVDYLQHHVEYIESGQRKDLCDGCLDAWKLEPKYKLPETCVQKLQQGAKDPEAHRCIRPAPFAKPIRSTEMERLCEDPRDAEFINARYEEGKDVVFQIMLGANYMDISSLVHLGAVKIATLIKGKDVAEITAILGVDGDDASGDASVRDRRRLSLSSLLQECQASGTGLDF